MSDMVVSPVLHLPNLDTAPPGEWQYLVPETGQLFRGPSLSSLVDQLQGHYRVNGYDLPLNLVALIEQQTCARIPDYCGSQLRQDQLAPAPEIGGLLHTFHTVLQGTKTLVSWVAGGGERVAQPQADTRAAICSTCPQNAEPAGCTGCNSNAMKSLADRIAGGRKTSSDARLQACKICSCQLKAKVWLPKKTIWPHMPEKQRVRLPANCWLVTET